MIKLDYELSIKCQVELLNIVWGSVYYVFRLVLDVDQVLMCSIDVLYLEYLFVGVWMLCDLLCWEGFEVGCKYVVMLMVKMGIQVLYCKFNMSKKYLGYVVYLYLFRGMKIEWVNQVWVMDIMYIFMVCGWVYFVVIIDWFSC